MAITSVKELKPARRIGMSWMIISILGAMCVGLVGIAYVNQRGVTLEDPETIFIMFSNVLFHPFITGFLLSAILAAIMSTISSQLLVTSSALTEDIFKTFFKRDATDKQLVRIGRLTVLLVSIVAISLSLTPNDTILDLVGYAWAGFGSAFGPAILLSLYWKRMNVWGALSGIIVGAVTVMIWISNEALKGFMYEMIPGFILSLAAIIIVSKLTAKPSTKVETEFDEMKKTLKAELE